MPSVDGTTLTPHVLGPYTQGSLGVQEEQYTQIGQLTDSSGNPLVSNELSLLVNSGMVLSSIFNGSGAFTNTASYGGFVSGGAAGNGAALFRLHFHGTFLSGAAAANTAVDGWFLCQPDAATAIETGASGLPPGRPVDFSFPVGGFSGVDVSQIVAAPIGSFQIKTLTRNNATGTSLNSGCYIKCYPLPRLIIGPATPGPNYP